MSYRPTISIYINGHIADIGYYRNWDDTDLFFEAVAIAALFYDCKSVSEYNDKKFGRQKVYYTVSPETFENTEENLDFFESCSEWPILVDLTVKNLYISEGAKKPDELLTIPSALEKHDNYGYRKAYRRTGMSCYECMLAGLPYNYDPAAYVEYQEEIPAVDRVTIKNIDYVMAHCRIPFDHVDMRYILKLFMKHQVLRRHLSSSTAELLDKEQERMMKAEREMIGRTARSLLLQE